MKLTTPSSTPPGRLVQGSVLIIVLWVAIGLISITLYFADAMSMELHAADNRASGVIAEQALAGAARYVGWALANFATNGAMPTNILFTCENIQIGDARAWIIGRDNTLTSTTATDPVFGLIDEASKLNLNVTWPMPLSIGAILISARCLSITLPLATMPNTASLKPWTNCV